MNTQVSTNQGMALENQIVNLRNWSTIILAGAFATLAFDLFGQSISPMLKSVDGVRYRRSYS